MKCANPDCNRHIGLVAYRRWFSRRRYCSKHCRDVFVANAPKGGGLNGSTQHLILKRQDAFYSGWRDQLEVLLGHVFCAPVDETERKDILRTVDKRHGAAW